MDFKHRTLNIYHETGNMKFSFQKVYIPSNIEIPGIRNSGIKNFKKYMLKGINNFRICRMSRIMLQTNYNIFMHITQPLPANYKPMLITF